MFAILDAFSQQVSLWAASLGWPAEGILRLVAAALAGGIVGIERELRGRHAGFRTYMLVAVGSALAMLVSTQLAYHHWPQADTIQVDPGRIAYGVMAGIGFLGAGTIIQTRGSVRGLTTAAGIWCMAAAGLAMGQGMYVIGLAAAIFIVLILWFMDYVEQMLPKAGQRLVTVRAAYHPGVMREVTEYFSQAGVRVADTAMERNGNAEEVEVTVRIIYVHQRRLRALEDDLMTNNDFRLLNTRDA
jgi:putative Mg2+ transporter-C (MgtC) family protein